MDIDDDNDSDTGDTSDDDLFFKRLEQKIHNGDNGKRSFSAAKKQSLDWFELPGNCWIMCGNKGGKCPACGGKEAYCCTREDWKLNLNGDCPDDAVKAIFKYTTGHVCVVTRGILP